MLRRSLAAFVLAFSCAVPLLAATPAPKAAPVPAASPARAIAPPAVARNDYANPAFTAPLGEGLRAFYARDFAAARAGFE
ncbi:MAG TPA: hypothetical protein VE826_11745, partial [Dongiaceae bacterium]|nr:hypothetical protein [Dongiaceae bacterium]